MKSFIVVFSAIFVFFSTNVFADDKLNLEIAYQVLHIVDWGTTRNMVNRQSEGYDEINPIIGSRPSSSHVDNFMIVSGVLHALITYLLPESAFNSEINPRKLWQHVTIGIEVGCVANNFMIGLNIDF